MRGPASSPRAEKAPARDPGIRMLAITGDDFGSSREVNRGIAEAYDRGVLTSASLLIGGGAAAEAITMARFRPGLAVGLHLAVVDARAILAPGDIPRLVGADGRFRGGPFRAGVRYQFSREAKRELSREIHAQLRRFSETGLRLSHVDGHHHMHLHPVVLEILIDLAGTFRIPTIRVPAEELRLALSLDPHGVAGKIIWSIVFALLRRHARRRLDAADIAFSERVYGLLATGRITEEYLLGLIPRIGADRVEIYCHPTAARPAQKSEGPPASAPAELAALLSERVRVAVAQSCFNALHATVSQDGLDHA